MPARSSRERRYRRWVRNHAGIDGQPTAVIVSIELWREIESERETAYLLEPKNMRGGCLKRRSATTIFRLRMVVAKPGI
jgi:hypothetical protein